MESNRSSDYTWGVDGCGRAHICKRGSNIVLFSMISGSGIGGVWILEAQDNNRLLDEMELLDG